MSRRVADVVRPRPGAVDGLNPDDPGMRMLADALADVPPEAVVSVCSGELPPPARAGTRIIVDERERAGCSGRVVAIDDPAASRLLPGITHAAVWPRAHLGKDFAEQTLARAGLVVAVGGEVSCAVRKQKGADGLADFMAELFSDVRVLERSKGYRLFGSRRTDDFDVERARSLLALRYRYQDPILGDAVIEAAPGVFSRRALDDGTRGLMEDVAGLELNPRRIIDLCAGVGPLAIWALRRWPEARAIAIESNRIAASLAGANAISNGVAERLEVQARAGLPPVDDRPAWRRGADLALVNPPTHADADSLAELFAPLPQWLAPGGLALLVAARPTAIARALEATGATVAVRPHARYGVIEARWAPSAEP